MSRSKYSQRSQEVEQYNKLVPDTKSRKFIIVSIVRIIITELLVY